VSDTCRTCVTRFDGALHMRLTSSDKDTRLTSSDKDTRLTSSDKVDESHVRLTQVYTARAVIRVT